MLLDHASEVFLKHALESNEEILNTIWHEIAHALSPGKHGLPWARVAVRLGCRSFGKCKSKGPGDRAIQRAMQEAEADPVRFVAMSFGHDRIWVGQGNDERVVYRCAHALACML